MRDINEHFFNQSFKDLGAEDKEKIRKLINGINNWLDETGYRPW